MTKSSINEVCHRLKADSHSWPQCWTYCDCEIPFHCRNSTLCFKLYGREHTVTGSLRCVSLYSLEEVYEHDLWLLKGTTRLQPHVWTDSLCGMVWKSWASYVSPRLHYFDALHMMVPINLSIVPLSSSDPATYIYPFCSLFQIYDTHEYGPHFSNLSAQAVLSRSHLCIHSRKEDKCQLYCFCLWGVIMKSSKVKFRTPSLVNTRPCARLSESYSAGGLRDSTKSAHQVFSGAGHVRLLWPANLLMAHIWWHRIAENKSNWSLSLQFFAVTVSFQTPQRSNIFIHHMHERISKEARLK